jgi:hypothetical protein
MDEVVAWLEQVTGKHLAKSDLLDAYHLS